MNNKEFKFWADPEYDYSLSYENAKTLDRYFELQKEISATVQPSWGMKELKELLENIHATMRKECDPQEIYCVEYNDYECCLSGSDHLPFLKVREIFGDEVAKTIKRVHMYSHIVNYKYDDHMRIVDFA